MNTKDIVIILVLIVILVAIAKMMKSSKEQNAVLMAVAIKTGAIDPKSIAKAKAPARSDEEFDDEEDDDGEERPKKIKLKKVQRQTVDLFSDGVPKQIGELRDLYMKKYSDIDKTKFYNTLYNLKPSKTLNVEKIDDVNYWGLGEWFDEDGSLYEEYAEKIPAAIDTTTQTNG